MIRKLVFSILCIFIAVAAHAQSADSIYNKYLDFNLERFQGENAQALVDGERILPNSGKLPEKTRTSFYFGLGKLYDDADQPDKALPLYEKVAVAAPDYYVVHRALGYIYQARANALFNKLNNVGNQPGADTLRTAFVKMAQKALPHLEKAQACDPSDETLNIIKALYDKIGDTQGLATLDDRLKKLRGTCQDILTDN